MDLTGADDTEETVAQSAVTQAPVEKAVESKPEAASETTERVKQLKQLYGIPLDLDGEQFLTDLSVILMSLSSIKEVVRRLTH